MYFSIFTTGRYFIPGSNIWYLTLSLSLSLTHTHTHTHTHTDSFNVCIHSDVFLSGSYDICTLSFIERCHHGMVIWPTSQHDHKQQNNSTVYVPYSILRGQVNTHMHLRTFNHLRECMHEWIHLYMCVCVCTCVCAWVYIRNDRPRWWN